MKIRVKEYQTCITYSIHEVDPEKYVEWLDGDNVNDETLLEYVNGCWNPINLWSDYYETNEIELDNCDEGVDEVIDKAEKIISKKITIF